ncbi:hypothetical protein I2I11_10630 [Pontibacter sp. 172403-2]|uniref:hypothetical protein n=1 Tax=Pontibacter rufus TaxID=2791028 RepID=UPI0018AFD205|nr:hypothetical protein [Pontibacter sp. 172403-2]MBF9253749.1 hypothetical protein [Pontibacter sp. 172403-2]
METEFKKRFLLLGLCERKYDGKYYDAAGLFAANRISATPAELKEILEMLGNDHLVKYFYIGERYLVQITMDGVEFLEESNFFEEKSYVVYDMIKPLQREILRYRLDDFTARICQSDIGAMLNRDEFMKEAEELKVLLNVLGRKHWMQMLKGKFYELCQGNVPLRRLKKILDAFENSQEAEATHPDNHAREATNLAS